MCNNQIISDVMAEAIKSEIKSEALLPNSNGVLLETSELESTSQNSNGPNLPKLTQPLTPTVLSSPRRASPQSRQRPERKPRVLNLSMTSWIFLVLAFIQGAKCYKRTYILHASPSCTECIVPKIILVSKLLTKINKLFSVNWKVPLSFVDT